MCKIPERVLLTGAISICKRFSKALVHWCKAKISRLPVSPCNFLHFEYLPNLCYSPAGRSVLGATVPEVLSTASDGTQTEGTVSPNTDRSRPLNNIFIFFLLRFKSFREILLHPPTYKPRPQTLNV